MPKVSRAEIIEAAEEALVTAQIDTLAALSFESAFASADDESLRRLFRGFSHGESCG